MIEWVEHPKFVYRDKEMPGAILDALVRLYEFDWGLLSKEGVQYAVKYRELSKLQQETLEIRYIQLMKEIDEAESKHKKP